MHWWFGSRVRIHHIQVVGWSASPIEFLFTSYYLSPCQKWQGFFALVVWVLS
ncbi:hypothetical protein K1L80_003830 [Vibrio fluvialis]|nr:hypothetical protein [Vibrio fluvialis]MBY8096557.1 hypothetical protein [Vibrio fluvialis]